MAKNDSQNSQTQIDQQGRIAQTGMGGGNNGLTGVQNTIGGQGSNMYLPQFQNAYNQGQQGYNDIMSGYQGYMNGLAPGYSSFMSGLSGMGSNAGLGNQGEIGSAMRGYQGFADNGGFSPESIQNFQAQAQAPVRAAYQQANNQLQTNRGLMGGYSPNFAAASSQMARQQAQQMAQANIGSNAAIDQMVQQGKLAGLGGLSSTALQNQGQGLQASAINNQFGLGRAGLGLQGLGQQGQQGLGALSGMNSLYGATPGLAGLYGSMLQGNTGQQLQGQGLQNQLGLGLISGQNQHAQIPGNFQSALGNITGGLGLAGTIAGGLSGLMGGFGSGLPSMTGDMLDNS